MPVKIALSAGRGLLWLVALAASVAFAGDEMSQEHRAAVDAIIAAQNFEVSSRDLFRQRADAAAEGIRRGVEANVDKRADLTAEHKARAKAAIDSLSPELARDIAREFAQVDPKAVAHDIGYEVYAPRFTTAELQQLAAFYSTPTGRKMLSEGAQMAIARARHLPDVDPFTPEEKAEIVRFNETPAARHVFQPEVQLQIDIVIEKHLAPALSRTLDRYRARYQAAVVSPPGDR